jgi:hypothetical protein
VNNFRNNEALGATKRCKFNFVDTGIRAGALDRQASLA